MKTKIHILIFILTIIFTSCSITKTKENAGINTQKNEKKFIYLFSEANKNRLLGNSQKAIEFYMSALDLNPKSAASNYYLASIFMSEKNYNSALTFAKKATKLQTNNLWYNLLEADIIYSQNNVNKAFIKYKSLQKQFPHNELLYDRIIEILLEKIKNENNRAEIFNELICIYNEKQKHLGFDVQIAEYLYNIYTEINDTKKAIETLKEMVKNEPEEPKYLAFMAENYVKSQKYNKAEDLYKKLLLKYPNDINVKLSYIKYCKFIGKKIEYFNTVKQLLNSNLVFNKKVNLIISGRHPNFPPNEYEKLLNILYKNHPNEILTNTLFTEYYIEKNKSKALQYLIKAAELSRGDFNLILTLFEVAYDNKSYEILYQQSSKYIQQYPNQAKVFLYNGIGAYNTTRHNEALKSLGIGKDLVIEDNKLLLQFHFYLAETYHSLKNNKKSDEQFEKVIELNPKFYLALNNYSYYLSARKYNLQKALSMAETCFVYQNNNPAFLDTYAKALFINKKYKQALIYSQKAINIIDNNPDFFENYGDILFANYKKQEALKSWNLSKKYGNLSDKLIYKINNINTLKVEDL